MQEKLIKMYNMFKIIMVILMSHEIDLKKYNLRTDLIIENNNYIEDNKVKQYDDIKITKVFVNNDEAKKINKKQGNYFTIEFEDVTDEENQKKLKKHFIKTIKEILKPIINDDSSILIVGLGNQESTPDSLGPKVIENITVTRHLFLLNELDDDFRPVSAFIPGVMGNTGIETSELIKNAVNSSKADILIVIDALASMSVERVNKTIQITDTGINPGSGIGNNRKEISKDTIGIPVIAIGVPTVVDAVSIVSDTIKYMHKNYAFNKKFINNPINKLVSSTKINYLKEQIEIDDKDKSLLLGLVGTLTENEVRNLINEVLSPIGYNLMITPKEIDFQVKNLSNVIADSLNEALKKTT